MEFPKDPADLPKFIDEKITRLRRTSAPFGHAERLLQQPHFAHLSELQKAQLISVIGWDHAAELLEQQVRLYWVQPPRTVTMPSDPSLWPFATHPQL